MAKIIERHFSLSVFTVEINGTPTVALKAKRHQEAERFCEQERLLAALSAITSVGVPLFGAKANLKVRLANPEEAELFRQAKHSAPPSDDPNVVYLVAHLDHKA